jgi:uncharacterized protein
VVDIGFTLQPEAEFLELLGDVLREGPDYFEIAPETTWRERPDGELIENGYSRVFRELSAVGSKSFVAHGVGFSVGTAASEDAPRRRRWLDRLALDQRLFRHRWYTDHLGATSLAGMSLTLPIAVPMTAYAAAVVRGSLRALQEICPDVGVENSVPYFFVGDPLDEPGFLQLALAAPRMHLLLDLHNVLTVAENAGFEPEEYLSLVDLTRVIEIHVSGGSYSDPAWLPGGRVMRLDGHDDAVPDAVFRLLERVAPRCPNLRGVTLERMEGTVSQADVPALRGELRSLRRIVEGLPMVAPPAPEPRGPRALPAGSPRQHVAYERAMVAVLTASEPVAALERSCVGAGAAASAGTSGVVTATGQELDEVVRGWLGGLDEAGVRMAALLVARLRFERLLRGSPEADAWFERDAAGFTEAFRRYHAGTPPTAFFPGHEARLFRAATGG